MFAQMNKYAALCLLLHVVKSKPIVVVPFGPPGVGKSTLMSFILDGYESQRFISSSSIAGGHTKNVTF